MTPAQLFTGIRDGDYHEGGIQCLQLLRLEPHYLDALAGEVVRLTEDERASDVGDPTHVTNWTRPRGKVLQFSLYNSSGRLDDFSRDHDASCLDKRFHGGGSYPQLARLIDWFPHKVNFRINVMGPRSSLAPHEEHALIRSRAGTICARLRLHLPIVTNPEAELILEGSVFRLEAGTIYLVNHGCVHAAINRAAQARIHLVWDMLLTREAFEVLFGDLPPSLPLSRIPEAEQWLLACRNERIGAVLRLPPLVSRADSESLEWCEVQ